MPVVRGAVCDLVRTVVYYVNASAALACIATGLFEQKTNTLTMEQTFLDHEGQADITTWRCRVCVDAAGEARPAPSFAISFFCTGSTTMLSMSSRDKPLFRTRITTRCCSHAQVQLTEGVWSGDGVDGK